MTTIGNICSRVVCVSRRGDALATAAKEMVQRHVGWLESCRSTICYLLLRRTLVLWQSWFARNRDTRGGRPLDTRGSPMICRHVMLEGREASPAVPLPGLERRA